VTSESGVVHESGVTETTYTETITETFTAINSDEGTEVFNALSDVSVLGAPEEVMADGSHTTHSGSGSAIESFDLLQNMEDPLKKLPSTDA
jgi:hypothetical protein